MPIATSSAPVCMEWLELSSLVGSIQTKSLVARPANTDECREVLEWCRVNGMTVCARGAGRSYGDMALNDGQALLDVSRMSRIIEFDADRRQITVEAGVRLIDIFSAVHHLNLTLPSSPTESHSSVSGAISANVNGKDGWRFGSFTQQVVKLTLLLANGELIRIDRSHELFNAVVGGIGLLGVIVDATLQLEPVSSPFLEVTRVPAADVRELLRTMASIEKTHDLAVVWMDAYARGRRLGRSVVHAAKWIDTDLTEAERRAQVAIACERLERHRRLGLAIHEILGPLLSLMLQAQRPMLAVFNRFYYVMNRVMCRLGRSTNTETFLKFSFEASFTVPPAHLVCGPRGYTLQVTFPRAEAEEAIIELLEICRGSPCPPVTTVLRAHKRDDCLLSFSEDGYSLNLEFHPKQRHRDAALATVDRLLEATIRRGGKLHLAKDQVATPKQFRGLYPRYGEFLARKRELDPDGLFTSDLARRVGIAGPALASPAVPAQRSGAGT